eukprot:gene5720-48013_t
MAAAPPALMRHDPYGEHTAGADWVPISSPPGWCAPAHWLSVPHRSLQR